MGVIEDRYPVSKVTNLSGQDLSIITNISGQVLDIPSALAFGTFQVRVTSSSYITSRWCQAVQIKPRATNAAPVYIGTSGVTSGTGYELQAPGNATGGFPTNAEWVKINIDNPNKVWFSGTSGQRVDYYVEILS